MKWNLFGHDWAIEILQKHIRNDSVRHAYLFSGTPGIGRRSLAIKFAQAINCLQPPIQGEACSVCRICKQTEKLQLPDLSIVQLDENKSEIRIEQIRELQKSLSLTPYEAKYRIALILNFQHANPNAQNALLKTLEEAPPKVILLITVDSVENLLPTISSRCEILRLRPLPIAEMELLLQKHWKQDEQSAHELAHLTSGRIGLANTTIADVQKQEMLHDWVNDCVQIFKLQIFKRFEYIEKLTVSKKRGENRDFIRQLLETWLLFWRDILLQKSKCSSQISFIPFAKISSKAALVLSLEDLTIQIKKLEESLTQLNNNGNIRLLLETIMLDWPILNLD